MPLVFGDVALDHVRGGTIISTETVFAYLARHLPVRTILLLGEVPGVLHEDGGTIPVITPENLEIIRSAIRGSAGIDVTGGMLSKVRDMLALTRQTPGLRIRVMDGRQAGLLSQTLLNKANPGTLIYTP
jgi:isopentenyl phosphate kinase